MAACDACGSTILFGGSRDGSLRFCNAKCHAKGYVVRVAQEIPADAVAHQTRAVYHGACPACGGAGPIDVRMSYHVWSALLMTAWKATPHIACRRCGLKKQAIDGVTSLLVGWWGFPWGLVMTPVQVFRNVAAAISRKDENGPTKELERAVRMMMASAAIQRSAANSASAHS